MNRINGLIFFLMASSFSAHGASPLTFVAETSFCSQQSDTSAFCVTRNGVFYSTSGILALNSQAQASGSLNEPIHLFVTSSASWSPTTGNGAGAGPVFGGNLDARVVLNESNVTTTSQQVHYIDVKATFSGTSFVSDPGVVSDFSPFLFFAGWTANIYVNHNQPSQQFCNIISKAASDTKVCLVSHVPFATDTPLTIFSQALALAATAASPNHPFVTTQGDVKVKFAFNPLDSNFQPVFDAVVKGDNGEIGVVPLAETNS